MFIEKEVINLLSTVRVVYQSGYVAPTELKRWVSNTEYYKHFVPTGLNMGQSQ